MDETEECLATRPVVSARQLDRWRKETPTHFKMELPWKKPRQQLIQSDINVVPRFDDLRHLGCLRFVDEVFKGESSQ
jgi:hypothetical protein